MDTYRLKYFCAICETGSLTKASEMLNISHSGLSKAMTALEHETRLKLFRPLGRGIEITKEGKWLYQHARDILRIENDILIGIQVKKDSIGIGFPEILAVNCSSLLANVLSEQLKILSPDVGELEGKISEGELDFGFTFSPTSNSMFEYLEIGFVSINSFASCSYIRDRHPEDFFFSIPGSNLPFNTLGYKTRDGWPQEISRKTKFTVDSFAIALDLLRSGKSLVYMPDFIANLENLRIGDKDKIIKVSHYRNAETQRRLFMVKPKNIEETHAMKKVSNLIRKICCSKNKSI